MIGKKVFDLFVTNEDKQTAIARVANLTQKSKGKFLPPKRYMVLSKDGSTFFLQIRSKPIKWKGKEAVLSIGRVVNDNRQTDRQTDRQSNHCAKINERI